MSRVEGGLIYLTGESVLMRAFLLSLFFAACCSNTQYYIVTIEMYVGPNICFFL